MGAFEGIYLLIDLLVWLFVSEMLNHQKNINTERGILQFDL